MELLHGQKVKFSLPDQRGKSRASILEKYRGIEYHRSGRQSECRIRFMPPARGLSHSIRRLNVPTQRSLSQRESSEGNADNLHKGHLSTTAACFGGNSIYWLLLKPLYNGLTFLSPRWPLCRGSTLVIMAGHGRAEIRNFSSSVEKYFTSERSKRVKYFFNTRREISYLQAAM